MQRDMHQPPISTDSVEAAAAFDHAVIGYMKFRADMAARLGALLAADPEFRLAHCLKGYAAMLCYKQANVPAAVAAAEAARRLSAGASPRRTRADPRSDAAGARRRINSAEATPQQDVLMQLFLDAALKTEADDVRLILAPVAHGHGDLAARIGYADAARQFVQ
jgi:hypothetical protein